MDRPMENTGKDRTPNEAATTLYGDVILVLMDVVVNLPLVYNLARLEIHPDDGVGIILVSESRIAILRMQHCLF